jgi:hypothetical protein
MSAQPKNKITRAEQGKRRHGNTPKLLKDSKSSIPMHKRSFFSRFMTMVTGTAVAGQEKKVKSKHQTQTIQGVSPQFAQMSNNAKGSFKPKAVRVSQHKG